MDQLTFRCSPGQEFDLFALEDWVRAQTGAAKVNEIAVRVLHPDREGDGNCRWCGCPRDEVVRVRVGRR